MKDLSRRSILKTSLGVAAVAGFPAIVPSTVFGQNAPSNRINIGAIGVGRISRGHDLPAIRKVDYARVIAVCEAYTELAGERSLRPAEALVELRRRAGSQFDPGVVAAFCALYEEVAPAPAPLPATAAA